jgi:hypothetical protein
MKKFILSTLLLVFVTTAYSQYKCYDFSKRYDRFLKFGVGKTIIPVKDVDGRVGTLVFIEGELPEFALGLHSTIRTGENYLKNFGEDVPISIDSRFTFVKNYEKNLQYGAYAQINSTGMWADGFVTGGVVRLRHEMERFGFFAEASVPVWGYHRRVISTTDEVISRSWFDTRIDPANRTRSTEYRITLATYLKINYY